MTALAIAVAGTLYLLKRLFRGREVSQDISPILTSTPSITAKSPTERKEVK
ncbi:MAG: hypothetical protein QXR34_10335 [Saccharolobus sp.]